MSDRLVRSCMESEEMTELACFPWMAHWMCTNCKSETKACGHVSIRREEVLKQNDGVHKHPLFQGFGDMGGSKRLRTNSEGFTLLGSLKKLRKENWEGQQSFPVFNAAVASRLGWDIADARQPPEAIPPLQERRVKFYNFLDDSNASSSKSFQDGPSRLDSRLTVPQLEYGSSAIPLFNSKDVEVNQRNSYISSPQHVAKPNNNDYTSSTFLNHGDNANSKLASRRLECSFSRQNDLMFECNSIFHKHVQEVPNISGVGLLPSTSSEFPKHEKTYSEFYSTPILQHAICNTETKIFAAADVEKESSRSLPQTIPFLKEIGFNLSEGGHMFGDTSVSKKLKGKSVRELLVSPEHSFPIKTGSKLLPYRSGTNNEGDDDECHANNLDHESSSQTDTMDMDGFLFQEKSLHGVALSPTNEHTEGGKKSPTSRSVFTSARGEIGGRPPFTKLHDMNQKIPAHAAYADSADERETSTSRTQSLDVEHLLAHAEQTTDSKSSADGPKGLDLNFRWIERLNLSTSHLVYGTKSQKMGEDSSREKFDALHKKKLKFSETNSQPSMDRFHDRKQTALEDTSMLLRNGELSSSESARTSSTGEDIPLSHPWIRRWSHKVLAPNKNSEATEVSQPQSPKATTLSHFQKKQFPSIAAMALMGKAFDGLNPCDFAKSGSIVVWNMKEF